MHTEKYNTKMDAVMGAIHQLVEALQAKDAKPSKSQDEKKPPMHMLIVMLGGKPKRKETPPKMPKTDEDAEADMAEDD